MVGQWSTLFRWLRRYFRAYGGFSGVVGSPFLGIAIIITSLSYSNWLTPNWVEKVETLIPSLLGFSLGTYAILFSIVGSRLKGALRKIQAPHGVSYLETINATFFHFIFVQVLSLMWAFLFQGSWLVDTVNYFKPAYPWLEVSALWAFRIGSFIGFFLLVYSILLTVAAALAVYRLALIKDPLEEKE
ncbi:hypothetical protein ACU8MP_03705 [Rhizobium leguminosarum]